MSHDGQSLPAPTDGTNRIDDRFLFPLPDGVRELSADGLDSASAYHLSAKFFDGVFLRPQWAKELIPSKWLVRKAGEFWFPGCEDHNFPDLKGFPNLRLNSTHPSTRFAAFSTVWWVERELLPTGLSGVEVMDTLRRCLVSRLGVPAWLAEQVVRRGGSVLRGKVSNWDDPKSFGRAFPPGVNLKRYRASKDDQINRYQLYSRVEAFIHSNPSADIDSVLLHEATEMGIGETKARELFKSVVDQVGDVLPAGNEANQTAASTKRSRKSK